MVIPAAAVQSDLANRLGTAVVDVGGHTRGGGGVVVKLESAQWILSLNARRHCAIKMLVCPLTNDPNNAITFA